MQRVLVVGDWLVDEHWVVGVHRLPSSSRTGQRHSRALHTETSTVRSLCGAGQVATILHQAEDKGQPCFDIRGLGVWNVQDEDTLARMLDPMWSRGRTPHTLTPKPSPDQTPERTTLHNLGEPLGDKAGTTRIIRIYEQKGDNFTLPQRIDWELRVGDESKALLKKDIACVLNKIEGSVDGVLIKDLRKGVVSPELVTELATRFGSARWYISSKEWRPQWLDKVPPERVRLLLIPQLATWMAMRQGKLTQEGRLVEESKVMSWTSPGGYPTKQALDAVEEDQAIFTNALVVVLPDGLRLMARGPVAAAHNAWFQTSRTHEDGALQFVPMASVFFPALVARLLRAELMEEKKEDPTLALKDLVQPALNYTIHWMKCEVERLRKSEEWRPLQDQRLQLSKGYPYPEFGKWDQFEWEVCKNHWIQAFDPSGLATTVETQCTLPGSAPAAGEGVKNHETGQQQESKLSKDKHYVDLWRGMTEIDGYICCVHSKRDRLRRLAEQIHSFVSLVERKHRSYMLIDSPGSGKTFLVKCLAKSLRLRMLSFNVTQMHSRDDLLACFDTIVTSQAQDPEEAILVFVDEINAKLDGHHVYDAFLAPIQEGVYLRAEKIFHIGPCVWVFAGTELPVPKDHGSLHDKSDKGSDFQSRLTIPPLTLGINKEESTDVDEAQIEKTYVGVSIIRAEFPDVRRISDKVLTFFKILPVDTSCREIEQFVKAFTDIQYGEVVGKCIPEDLVMNLGIAGTRKNAWKDSKDTYMAEIRTSFAEYKGSQPEKLSMDQTI
jgi:hypothetical protein